MTTSTSNPTNIHAYLLRGDGTEVVEVYGAVLRITAVEKLPDVMLVTTEDGRQWRFGHYAVLAVTRSVPPERPAGSDLAAELVRELADRRMLRQVSVDGDPVDAVTLVRRYGAAVADAARRIAMAEQGLPSCGHDMEAHAASYNQGYAEAVAQGLADDPTLAQDWLAQRDAGVQADALAELADSWRAERTHHRCPPGGSCRECMVQHRVNLIDARVLRIRTEAGLL